MFHPTDCLIEACITKLQHGYADTYGQLEPAYPGIIAWAARMALETIRQSDALYHNVEHTVLVTLVGQDILTGKHFRDGKVAPRDWLHFILACLYHDIGYVRGICRDDRPGSYTIGAAGELVRLSAGATDAALTPYHVDRGKRFVQERFGGHAVIDAEILAAHIERTRFPIPEDCEHQATADYPGLVRAADFIGQLADPRRYQKLPALFYEFEEIGLNARCGYTTPEDLLRSYPAFYWNCVNRYLTDGLRHLSVTHQGQQWVANLYAQVFRAEHGPSCCSDREPCSTVSDTSARTKHSGPVTPPPLYDLH